MMVTVIYSYKQLVLSESDGVWYTDRVQVVPAVLVSVADEMGGHLEALAPGGLATLQ